MIQMADKLGVVLIDGEKLKVMIESAKKKLGGPTNELDKM